MNQLTQELERAVHQLSFAAVAIGIAAVMISPAQAGDGAVRRASPCDVRDTCSADPSKYAEYRESGVIKAREYVGEMRWGGGGAPDDVYVISKTVGSRDFANANPCDVRDACTNGKQTYQIVRSGPSATDVTTAAKADEVKVANDPSPK